MERRILEAKDLHQKLKRECEATVDLLNMLLQTCASHVDSLDKLNSNEHRTNLKYFLTVSQFQHATHQKLSELNVELEEYLLDSQVSDFEHFREASYTQRIGRNSESSSVCTLSSPTVKYEVQFKLSDDLLKVTDSTELRNPDNKVLPYFPCETVTCTEKLCEYDYTTQRPLETSSVLNDSASTSNTEIFFDLEDAGEYKTDDVYVQYMPNVTQETSTNHNLAQEDEANLSDIILDKPESNPKRPIESYISETLKPIPLIPLDEYRNNDIDVHRVASVAHNVTQKISTNQNLIHGEDKVTDILLDEPEDNHNKPGASYISETLKALPLTSFQEKYMKIPPRPKMPDISLKPSGVKCFVDTNRDVNIENVSLNDDVEADTSVVERKITKKTMCKESKAVPPNMDSRDFAVFEIDYRQSPLVGDICMIGFVESPSNFYIQVSDENSVFIDVIATQLAEINNNTFLLCHNKQDAMHLLGKFCTLAIDGSWYRAEVIDWLQNCNSDDVYVQLIDYGSQYSVIFKDLRPLPAFCRSHRLAQKCFLAYLYPPASTKRHKLKQWPVACKEAFLNYCGDIDKSEFRITYIHPSQQDKNAFEIDLVRLSEDSDDKSIGEILLEAQLAVQIIDDLEGLVKHNGMCSQILAAHGCAGITSNMTQEEVLDIYFDEVDEEPSNINEAVMKYNPRDEAETCRNLRPDGTCYKGTSCKWRHEVLRSGFTNDKVPVYSKAFSDLSLPVAGEDILLTISHVIDIQCFYAQIRNEAIGITSSINDLITAMNEPQMIKRYLKFEQVPYAGEIVIAKYWNNYWYRGQVRDIDNPDCKIANAEVYFVDFGDVLTVAVSDLRNIIPDFLYLPFQAIECRMYNLKNREDADQDEEKRYFESKFLGGTLKAQVVAVPGHLQVLLENGNGQDVGLQLIEEGFGEFNTEHNFPQENELILID